MGQWAMPGSGTKEWQAAKVPQGQAEGIANTPKVSGGERYHVCLGQTATEGQRKPAGCLHGA
jgi:hypothetical protein